MNTSVTITIIITATFVVLVAVVTFFGGSIVSFLVGSGNQPVRTPLVNGVATSTSNIVEIGTYLPDSKSWQFPFKLIPHTSLLPVSYVNSFTGAPTQPRDKFGVIYFGLPANSNNKNFVLFANGVIGTGTSVRQGDKVSISFTWTTKDIAVSKPQLLQFTVGGGKIISGLEEGVIGMKVGGRRTLTIEPSLAYGDHSVGKITANSIIVVFVQLNGVIPLTK